MDHRPDPHRVKEDRRFRQGVALDDDEVGPLPDLDRPNRITEAENA